MLKIKISRMLARLRGVMRAHHHLGVYIVASIITISVASGVAFVALYQQPVEVVFTKPLPKKVVPPAPPAIKYYSPLTGLEVADDVATKQAATGIMIENSPDARPQSGIKSAGVVFEAIAEGGITRFLALYQEAKPQLIGPVRSVRLYYVDWLAPFNASVAHIGGSLFALREVRNGQYRDIDQFFDAGTYWRATDRYAPHNVYTSFAKLDALNAAKGYNSSNVAGFERKADQPAPVANAGKIDIKISGPLYNSSYVYDKTTNSFVRSQAGKPHLDREGGQIAPKVVIALRVNMSTIFEDGYREQISTIGDGKAVIFQDGVALDALWHKSSRSAQLTFTDPTSGKPILLNRGQTWISAVPNGSGGVSWRP